MKSFVVVILISVAINIFLRLAAVIITICKGGYPRKMTVNPWNDACDLMIEIALCAWATYLLFRG